jgi:hypothetical protein
MTRSPIRDTAARPNMMRSLIAARAARLMAEDGIADFSLAKRKAARQLGAPSTQALPNNDEVEAELRAYRGLYQQREHAEVLLALRQKALEAMRFFQKFEPYLTGAVLTGSAGEFSTVNVELYAANEKEFELFLLERRIKFEIVQESGARAGRGRPDCVLQIDWNGVPFELALYEPDAIRGALRSAGGAGTERANLAAVERLLTETGESTP